jgi:membrane protein required for beta-lactamase induction
LELRFLWSAVMSHRFGFFLFMECGDVTPLLFHCLAWQRAQKKKQKKQEKHRNQSGVTSPHSINSVSEGVLKHSLAHASGWYALARYEFCPVALGLEIS